MRLQVDQDLLVQVVGETAPGPSVGCTVSNIGPSSIAIKLPGLVSLPAGLVPGCRVLLRLTDEHGVHTALTQVKRTATTPITMFTVAPPQSFATTQNRKFFRVSARLPVICTITSSWDKTAVGKIDEAGKTQDISAGGMRLATVLTLCVGDELALVLKVPNLRGPGPETTMQLKARVSRVGAREKEPRNRVISGVEFILNKREQDALVPLMLDLQRKTLR